jgi:hypothetical protein
VGRRIWGSVATMIVRVVIIGFSVTSQRMVLGAEMAMPPQPVVLPEGGKAGGRAPVLLAQLLAQAPPIVDSDVPSAQGASSGPSSEPQTGGQETISVAHQLNSTQRRRRPKMASVPSGSQIIAQPENTSQPSESVPPVIQQAGIEEKAEPTTVTGASVAQPAEAEGGNNTQPSLAENGEQGTGEDNSPGAIARRKAEYAANKRYKLAPIFWRGTVFEEVAKIKTRFSGSLGPSSPIGVNVPMERASGGLSHTQGVKVGVSSYILAPWVAEVGGKLGVVGVSSRPDGGGIIHSNRIIGGARLALFKQSRFPFHANFDVKDSRGDGRGIETVNTADSVSKILNLYQSYRPRKGPSRYKLRYYYTNNDYQRNFTNNALEQSTIRSSTNSFLSGNYSTRLGRKLDSPLFVNGSHQTSSVSSESAPYGSNANVSYTRDIINANNVYAPEDSLLTLISSGTFFQVKNPDGYRSRSLQLQTHATWQPEALDNPLVLRGGAQYSLLQNQTPYGSSNVNLLKANILATYNKWSRVSLSGGGTVTAVNSNGVSSLITTQFGNVSYNFPKIRISGGSYIRAAKAGFLNEISASSSRFTSHLAASHQLTQSRNSLFGYRARYTTTLAQSLAIQTAPYGNIGTLSHSATLTWVPLGLRQRLPGTYNVTKGVRERSAGQTNFISLVRLSASDSRTFGIQSHHNQSFGLTAVAGGGGAYNATASGYGGNAGLTIEFARSTNGTSSGGITGYASWGWLHRLVYTYNYRKRKVWGIKGLDYRLLFKANLDPRLRTQTSGNFQSSNFQAGTETYLGYGTSLTQGLQYRIGFNEILLVAYLGDNYGLKTASLFLRFRAWRNFGN